MRIIGMLLIVPLVLEVLALSTELELLPTCNKVPPDIAPFVPPEPKAPEPTRYKAPVLIKLVVLYVAPTLKAPAFVKLPVAPIEPPLFRFNVPVALLVML